jgi:hypothetical protein
MREHTRTRRVRGARAVAAGVAAIAILALAPASGQAQQGADSRWLPWLGCWETVGVQASDMYVCVRPGEGGVEVATVADNQVASTRTIQADGQRHELSEDGCTGWQTAEFSSDNRRVFLRSERTCDGVGVRTASAIMSLTSSYEWLDAQSIGVGTDRMPRAMRYRLASAEIARDLGFAVPADRVFASAEARTMATKDLTIDDVREAAKRVDPEALQAFLIERGQTFDVDAQQIAAMADDGISPDVIDIVVAVSYPDRFQIDRDAMHTALQPEEQASDKRGVDRYGYDPFGWGMFGYYGVGSYYSRCNAFTPYYDLYYCSPYSRLGYGYGYGGGFGYDPYWWGYSGRPVIIVRGDTQVEPPTPGRVVRGRGYTRGGSSGSGSGSASGSSGTRAAPPPSSRSGGARATATKAMSGTSSGASKGTSSGGATRTAKKKGGGGL